ncbi:hypothetical protein, partial [uncultured Akkermansia sp.]|uniref:hypothetical protein n=1 Tax=uncultured Akkermansia sp. TaxID=512294 RepID=UPI002590CFCA
MPLIKQNMLQRILPGLNRGISKSVQSASYGKAWERPTKKAGKNPACSNFLLNEDLLPFLIGFLRFFRFHINGLGKF